MMCELKCGYAGNPAKLWKLCSKFFDKMTHFVDADASVVACFVTEATFTTHSPQKRATKKSNTSAYEARERVQAHLAHSPRFVILENVCSATVLPLRRLIAEEADLELSTLSTQVDSLYIGSPNHQAPLPKQEHK